MADPPLTGVLLVGGASTRFGSPKALAVYEGETFADRAWRLLGAVCDERIAVGKGEYELPFEVLDDGTDVRAPIAGVVAGLRAASSDFVVVIPVDVPLLKPTSLRVLAVACRDAAVTHRGPLPGAYRRSVLPVLEEALAEGRLALRDALRDLDVATIQFDDHELINVNTPDDVRRL